MSTLSLDKILNDIDAIPAMPITITKALQIINSPDVGPKELADVIVEDQNITATLLKYSNSALYGLSRKISTVSEAVVLLGFSTVKSILLASAVGRVMDKNFPGYALERGELWRHSLTVALVSKTIAKKVKYPQIEQAFVAGLIHDIGKVILHSHVSDKYEEIVKVVENEQISFMNAEKRLLDYSHAEVGAMLAEKWNFPSDLVESIAFHHSPLSDGVTSYLPAIIHVADTIALMLGIGIGSDGLLYIFEEDVMEKIGLTEKDIELIIAEFDPNIGKELLTL